MGSFLKFPFPKAVLSLSLAIFLPRCLEGSPHSPIVPYFLFIVRKMTEESYLEEPRFCFYRIFPI